MRALTAHQVVELWDRGAAAGAASRALAILAAADPGASPADLRALPVGARDYRLLAVRALTLGRRLSLAATCASCGVGVELDVAADDIGLGVEPDVAATTTCHLDGHTIVLRPVTAGDLVEVEHERNPESAAAHLLSGCVISVDGQPAVRPALALVDALEDALESLDAAASPEIVTTCPDCGHTWSLWFDAGAFFWEEIQIHAPRLLAEVATLARYYHWSERDILAMSAPRRRFYLEAIES